MVSCAARMPTVSFVTRCCCTSWNWNFTLRSGNRSSFSENASSRRSFTCSFSINGSVPAINVNGSVPAIRQLPLDTCSGGRDSGDGMARKLRIQYPGAVYHVMNRGERRESIFHDNDDRQRFIETLGEVCGKTGWQVHAYCLMPNHFHLVLETPRSNLVAGMKWFLGTSTARFNRRHKLFGHLF